MTDPGDGGTDCGNAVSLNPLNALCISRPPLQAGIFFVAWSVASPVAPSVASFVAPKSKRFSPPTAKSGGQRKGVSHVTPQRAPPQKETAMSIPSEAICETIAGVYYLQDSPIEGEAANAREKLSQLRIKHGIGSLHDLQEVLGIAAAAEVRRAEAKKTAEQSATTAPASDSKFDLLDILLDRIDRHVRLAPSERMIVALWIIHTYIFDQFDISPRLLIFSPTNGCGKSELMKFLKATTNNPYLTTHITSAGICRVLNDPWIRSTLLLDDGENTNLLADTVMRAIFDGGYDEQGGSVDRARGKGLQKYNIYAPLAFAGVTKNAIAPPSVLQRAHVINMRTAPRGAKLKKVIKNDPAFEIIRGMIQEWAQTCSLAPDPEMPAALAHRECDNWRTMLAIADTLGRGAEARAVAVEIQNARPSDDASNVLLWNIRVVRDKIGGDRITHKALVAALLDLEDQDYAEWCGPDGTQRPRKFSTSDLVVMLRPYGITAKNLWPT
jgi:Protein of unknown function (DUF3631)